MNTKILLIMKWNEILNVIYKSKNLNTTSEIHMATNITYSHVVKVVQEMEQLGLIKKIISGREKHIELTEKGLQVAKANALIINVLNE